MARIINSIEFDTQTVMGNVTTLGCCVEADSYEEAKALAIKFAQEHFQNKMEQMLATQLLLQSLEEEYDTPTFDGSEDDGWDDDW